MCNLTEKDYKEILQRKCRADDIKLVSYTVKPISEGEGFLGDHFKLEIVYEQNNQIGVEYFFIKTKPTNFQAMKDLANETDVFTLEIFLYDFLFPEFDKHGIDTSFAPKCYYSVPSETLVLEDMAHKGYSVPHSQKLLGLEECKEGLRTISSYHASGFLYEQAKSKELGRKFCLIEEYPKMLEEKFLTFYCKKRNHHGEMMFTMAIDILLAVIDHLPESEDFKKDYKEKLQSYPLGKVVVEETTIQKFLGHGDLWATNFLFKLDNERIESCALVDYQTTRYFYASFDVLNFLVSNTHPDFYQKHSDELLSFYYEALTEKLAPYNIKHFYSKEDFRTSLDLVEFEAKLQAYGVHAFILIPDEFTQQYISPGVNLQEYKFSHIVPVALDYFQKDKEYRNIILKDLEDLRATLLKL